MLLVKAGCLDEQENCYPSHAIAPKPAALKIHKFHRGNSMFLHVRCVQSALTAAFEQIGSRSRDTSTFAVACASRAERAHHTRQESDADNQFAALGTARKHGQHFIFVPCVHACLWSGTEDDG